MQQIDKSPIKLTEKEKYMRENYMPNRIWATLTEEEKQAWIKRVTA